LRATLLRAIGRSFLALFEFDGAASSLPGIETALQGMGLGESSISELLRRMGAGFFIRSGSVDDRELIFGPGRIDPEFIRVHADGA
jgi:hypothetical protein